MALTPGWSDRRCRRLSGVTGGHRERRHGVPRQESAPRCNFDGMGDPPCGAATSATPRTPTPSQEMVRSRPAASRPRANADGLVMNLIPKEGGNSFSGSVSGTLHERRPAERQLERRPAGPRPARPPTRCQVHLRRGRGRRRPDQEGQAVVLHGAPASGVTSESAAGIFCNKTQGTPFYTPDFDRPADRSRVRISPTPAA